MPTRGSARRALVLSFVFAACAWLAGCAPIPGTQDPWSSGGGGGGGGASSRAGWVAETHEDTTRRADRDAPASRATTRDDTLDLRAPRVGQIYCRKCQ